MWSSRADRTGDDGAPRNVRRLLWVLVGLGVALRILAPFRVDLSPDGSRYALIGLGLSEGHGFSTLWPAGDGELQWIPDANYSPLWPLVLGAAYSAFGYSVPITKVVGVVVGLASLWVVHRATRGVAGEDGALLATALVAVYPRLVVSGGAGNAEDLALIFFVLAMWAILRSLERPWWFVVAGAFAGLTFLTRSAAGILFIVAGLFGLAWRITHRGARGVTAIPYLSGVVVFAALVAVWIVRNALVLWDGDPAHFLRAVQGSPWAVTAREQALARPGEFFWAALEQAAVFAGILLPVVVALAPPLRRALRIERLRDEATSGLWLAVVTTAGIALFMGGAFHLVEPEDVLMLEHERYLLFALVPLAWLAARERPMREEWRDAAALFCLIAAISAGAVGAGLHRGDMLASQHLGEIMPEGASVEGNALHLSYSLAYYVEKDPRIVAPGSGGDYAIIRHPPPGTDGIWFEGSPLLGEPAVLQVRNASRAP